MHHDLNIPVLRTANDKDRRKTLQQLVEYDYGCAALNTVVYGRMQPQHRCQQQPIPLQDPRKHGHPVAQQPQAKGSSTQQPAAKADHTSIQQLTRITVVVETLAEAQLLSVANDTLLTYDLVAAQPTSSETLARLCESADVDIIQLDLGQRMSLRLRKKTLDAAIARGITFEVTYGPVIKDANYRRALLGNVQALLSGTRGRDIILSSGADSAAVVRGPHDVMNLGQVLGLKEEQARRALRQNAEAVVRHAKARRLRQRPVTARDDLPTEDLHQLRFPKPSPAQASAKAQQQPVQAAALSKRSFKTGLAQNSLEAQAQPDQAAAPSKKANRKRKAQALRDSEPGDGQHSDRSGSEEGVDDGFISLPADDMET